MKPRVFVSSTYYDLKYLRERIEKFLKIYGFDTILFESNNITYEHGKAIDVSVYNELEMCHMMILIVGGRYGSAISSDKLPLEEQKKYDDEYVSITRKEFETASEKNIPIFIFIDKNVYSDFESYKKNIPFFEKVKKLDSSEYDFQFAHVDSLNVFKFISNLTSKAIKTFEKAEEIEEYLQSQLAGMFYLYLQSLQKQGDDKKILNSVEELNNVTKLMSEMLDSVGKKVLGENNAEYIEVIDKQFEILVDYFTASLPDNITLEVMEHSTDDDDDISRLIAQAIYDYVLSSEMTFPEVKSSEKRKLMRDKNTQVKNEINSVINGKYPFIILENINATFLNNNYYANVIPFIRDKVSFEEKIITKIASTYFWLI